MVALTEMRASNALVATDLPPKLVGVFIGATAGIGEGALKQFAKVTISPRLYFVGRSKESGARILEELKTINPKGEYTFISSDVSLIKNVDDVCRQIKEKEAYINVLFMSVGIVTFGTQTSEGLHAAFSLVHYARTRFILNLLPLIRRAPSFRRVVSCAGGTKEGAVIADDVPALGVSLFSLRPHMTSVITLTLEKIAETAPDVTFIHDFPGAVKTSFLDHADGLIYTVARTVLRIVMPFIAMDIDESGERQVFFLTSKRYAPKKAVEGISPGVGKDGTTVVIATSGKAGDGVYTIDEHGEPGGPKIVKTLAGLREDGTQKKIWQHTMEQYIRITGKESDNSAAVETK